jgi:hypothetical protein
MFLQEYNQQQKILLKSDWSKIKKFLTSEKMRKWYFKTYRCISATKLHIFVLEVEKLQNLCVDLKN